MVGAINRDNISVHARYKLCCHSSARLKQSMSVRKDKGFEFALGGDGADEQLMRRSGKAAQVRKLGLSFSWKLIALVGCALFRA